MSKKNLLVVTVALAGFSLPAAWARDLRITVPRQSHLTPVQRLNREGVDAVRNHQYEKAEALFYKAYLYDAADPFTLNNLGYISELEGKLDRARKFYAMASEQDSNAVIDRSNAPQLEGKPMTYAFQNLQDTPMQINRMNVTAIQLLAEHRNIEAHQTLEQALAIDPQNPFTLNNLGVAEETEGDYDAALQHYDEAASLQSTAPVVVTLDRTWRGKPVSEMASASARNLRKRLQGMQTNQARAGLFAFRGVSALNRNDWDTARQDFLQAYSIDPESAFSLNNRAFLAEQTGDLETAQFFYSKARHADNADAVVGLATQQDAEGKRLNTIAVDNREKVTAEVETYQRAARQQTGPIELIPRGNSAAPQSPSPAPSNSTTAPQNRQ